LHVVPALHRPYRRAGSSTSGNKVNASQLVTGVSHHTQSTQSSQARIQQSQQSSKLQQVLDQAVAGPLPARPLFQDADISDGPITKL